MTGILLIQLGTPDAPTFAGLFPYLRQFLTDPRVIEVPRLKWLPLLYGVILPFRSGASAAKYRRIWDAKTGSPLLHHTVRQTELLQEQFARVVVSLRETNPSVVVSLRETNPSVVVSLRETNPSVVVSLRETNPSVVVSLRETNPSVVVSLRETNPSVVVSLRETNPHAERADYTEQLPSIPVRFGMMIGNPPLARTVSEMIAAGVDRLIAFPMFPQYSATTFASATDVLFKALMRERRVPALRVVPPYYRHPGYLDAVEASIRTDLAQLSWEPQHYVISFHGIPQEYSQKGDPYATQVVRTTQELVQRMGWKREQWTQSYQSRFGRKAWLKPYTDDVLTALAKKGVKRVYVALPGFTADCLETLDEIGRESREVFEHAGGENFKNGTCLNEHPAWIAGMARIIRDEGQGWL